MCILYAVASRRKGVSVEVSSWTALIGTTIVMLHEETDHFCISERVRKGYPIPGHYTQS
jgi:hypothetical protein